MAKIWGVLFLIVCVLGLGFYVINAGETGEPVVLEKGCNPDMSEASAAVELPDGPAPEADAIVFDMEFVGLNGEDEFTYNSYWGYGSPRDQKSAFVAKAKKVAGKGKVIYNPNFKNAEYSLLELKGKEPIAFYFDLNADGKVTDNEKLLPVKEKDEHGRVEFITPDFVMTTQKDQQVPFRALLQARDGGNSMWSPSCVMKGSTTINDKKIQMILYANGLSGSFVEFGRGYCAFQEQSEEKNSHISRQTLSSLINYEGQFYRMRFINHPDKKGTIRTVLEKDTSDTGTLAVKLAGKEGIKTRLSSATINGAADSTIQFNVSGDKEITLPVGEYKLQRGYIYYGKESSDEYYVNFSQGPLATIEADKRFDVEIGKPKVIVSAIDQKKRYSSQVEEKSVYEKGTTVFLSPKIQGNGGELYSSFSKTESKRRVDVEPTVEILDSKGKQVAEATMEYG